jgi:hypothetical protein
MQIRQSQFVGDIPPCSLNPKHRIHRHGHYDRCANCNDEKMESIFRFLCRLCRRTISVLPDHLLPYRTVSVSLLQKDFEARVQGKSPPKTTPLEEGCLKRAWHRFTQRTAANAACLGQIMQFVKPTAKQIWSCLRQWGNLSAILVQLARAFNTSLLKDYLCLRPWALRTAEG